MTRDEAPTDVRTTVPSLRRKLERHLDELPVLPTVIAKLMTLDANGARYFDDVRHVVESDPNFSARILVAANSAASAPAAPITTVLAAVTRIGTLQAANLVLAISIAKVFVPRDPWEKSLWRHALQVAITARALAVRCHDPEVVPDEAYTCGLLHDVGRFVMFQEAPDQLRQIDEGDWDSPEALVAVEQTICGVSHAELGALACTKWGLPELISHVVRDHHVATPHRLTEKLAKLTALVRFADVAMFPSAMPGTPGCADANASTIERSLLPKLPAFLRLSLHELTGLLIATTAEAEAICQSIGVS